jgi:hypothetical protein
MKVMAVGTLKPLSQEQRQQYLPKEVPATLQLYLDGKMEQFWLREKEAGVIFLMSVESVEEADGLLKALPLGQANLLTFDLIHGSIMHKLTEELLTKIRGTDPIPDLVKSGRYTFLTTPEGTFDANSMELEQDPGSGSDRP